MLHCSEKINRKRKLKLYRVSETYAVQERQMIAVQVLSLIHISIFKNNAEFYVLVSEATVGIVSC